MCVYVCVFLCLCVLRLYTLHRCHTSAPKLETAQRPVSAVAGCCHLHRCMHTHTRLHSTQVNMAAVSEAQLTDGTVPLELPIVYFYFRMVKDPYLTHFHTGA